MKLLALGGSGSMGATAVKTAVGLPGVDETIVADLNYDAAKNLARELNEAGANASALRVDVTDSVDLHAALGRSDIVLNTVGPYYRFGLTVLRAAIATGTHYLDICDDWEPTFDMLELDADAQKAGVCAVVGMGASPGMSNLLALRAARELEIVDDVYTAWSVDGHGSGAAEAGDRRPDSDVGPSAAAVHWMQQISGTIAVVRDGRVTYEPPLRPVALTLPGARNGTAYTVGHPEPVTLQTTLSPTGDSANLMILSPRTAAYLDVLRIDIDKGLLTNESAANDLVKPSMWRLIKSMVRTSKFEAPGTLPSFFAAATGTVAGERRTVLARLEEDDERIRAMTGDMAQVTGIPLALGLSQILDGTATRSGVHAADAIIDPDRFFTELGKIIGRGELLDAVVLDIE